MLKQFKDSRSDVFSISHINILIGLTSCIFALVYLINSIQTFSAVGEADPGILYMFMPIPLSDLITDSIEAIVLLIGGVTLLLKKNITIIFYSLYCILQLISGFELDSNIQLIYTRGLYYFISSSSIISILLLFYFNNSRVLTELNVVKRLNAKEYILYCVLSIIVIFLAYYYRSLLFDSYKIGLFDLFRLY